MNPQTAHAKGHLSVNGHDLYWEMYGQDHGDTILLLHHGLGSSQSLRRQIPPLVEQGWRILVYDRWGYGRSDPRPFFEPKFLHKDAEEAMALLAAHDIEEFSLVGHSDGGSIALLIAAKHPNRVKRMVLIAAHIYVESKMEEGLKLIETSAKVPPFRDVLAREHGERAAHLVESWLNCWYEHGERTLNLQEYLPEIHCPTLVIQGALDEHATPQHARDIAAGIPNAQLWIIPEVRHMPIHEVTDQLNQVLVDFLKNQKLVFSHSHEKERDV